MLEFMVVTVVDGNPHADFFNEYWEAEDYQMNVTCGLGGYAEVYERVSIMENGEEVGKEYRLLYA